MGKTTQTSRSTTPFTACTICSIRCVEIRAFTLLIASIEICLCNINQDHLSETQGGVGQGPVIGHAVSADMVTWSHLPVAVWNDQPYDSVAIYTGSATIVNGVPTMVYPGLCNSKMWPECKTGTLFAIALPADHAGDPLLTNWTKPSYNPIFNDTQVLDRTFWFSFDTRVCFRLLVLMLCAVACREIPARLGRHPLESGASPILRAKCITARIS